MTNRQKKVIWTERDRQTRRQAGRDIWTLKLTETDGQTETKRKFVWLREVRRVNVLIL